MNLDLTSVELRVLGCLIEKDLSTPEYYPLSLNALVNACNQKSNRDPVASLDEAIVFATLTSLRDMELAVFVSESGSRVEKYRHQLSERYNFSRPELAILAELMLRGPQTPGELKTRCTRMHTFDEPETVEHWLRKLAAREQPLTVQLPRQTGQKDQRWNQLIGRHEGGSAAAPQSSAPAAAPRTDRLAAMEAEIEALRQEVDGLKMHVERLSTVVGRLQSVLE